MNSTNKSNGSKILFACVPADGHFSPLTGLAKHLQQVGYDVRWYSATYYEGRLKQLNIPFYKFNEALDITAADLETPFPDRKNIKGVVRKLNYDLENFFIRRGPEYYRDMQEIHQDFPFDLLISDSAFTGSIFVKELMKIPVISVGVMPLIESSRDLPPNGLGMEPSYSLAGRLKQRLLHFLVKKILFRRPNKLMHRILEEHRIKHDNLFMFDLMSKKSDFILQSGTPGFEFRRSDISKNIRFIGSLLPYRAPDKKKSWFDKRLEEYQRILLVTQGTVERDVNKIIVPTLEAFKDSSTLVICTTGGSYTEELKSKYNQPNIIVEDFIPFDEVMPYCNAYITNGGYGGVMLGIENKLPLIVAGIHEGKNEICARVGYLKYGINLKTENPSVKQIRNAVEKVLSTDLYKRNIERLSEEFSTYNPNELCAQYVEQVLDAVPQSRYISFGIHNSSSVDHFSKEVF